MEGLQSLLDHMATSKQELAELINKYDTDNRNHIGNPFESDSFLRCNYKILALKILALT